MGRAIDRIMDVLFDNRPSTGIGQDFERDWPMVLVLAVIGVWASWVTLSIVLPKEQQCRSSERN